MFNLIDTFSYITFVCQGEAVQLVADGVAPKLKQPEEGATYEPIAKKNIAKVDFSQPAKKIHDFIRGMDKVPGAWTTIDGQVRVTILYYLLVLIGQLLRELWLFSWETGISSLLKL